MEITEFKFIRVQSASENQSKLGICEITLDHSVILDEVQLIESEGELRLDMWGATLCDFDQLRDSLKLGFRSSWLEDFRSRLRGESELKQPSQTRAA